MKLNQKEIINNKKIAVLTSGGDAPGMNAAIRGVTRAALYYDYDVYGILDGFRGIYNKQFVKLHRKSVADTLNRGGTFLGSARFEEFKQTKIVEECANNLKEIGINHLVIIGGDGSYLGGKELIKQGINVICLPGTIDNDILSSDFSIGYDTAVNTVVEAIDKIRDTLNSHHRCSIIEVMGRNCANIANRAGIAVGAEMVITTKEEARDEKIINAIKSARQNNKKHALIIIREGIVDVFKMAEGIEKNFGYETRASILGHIQRGGTPSALDRYIASKMGAQSVELFNSGINNVCLGSDGHSVYYSDLVDAVTKESYCFCEELDVVKLLK